MHKRFDHAAIEKKWQAKWDDDGLYNAPERDNSKEKEYVLVELPYPSGNLHIGHWYAFGVPDIYVRLRRMQGKQVLFPMGFDAFGLPAENAAIKNNVNPREWTQSNIEYMRGQLASMGNAFTWDTTCSTIDPDYYRWTQWMFTQFFENDIAYRGEGTVNWCPTDNTVIANEQVLSDDTCERCGDTIEKKTMPQWMLRITDYADALTDDLDDLDWPEHIKDAQRAWIGRSQGAEIDFTLSTDDTVTVFTTRPDTLYGATYMVLAPEHALVDGNKEVISNWDEVAAYIDEVKGKKEMDRLDATKEKTGVKLEGITATNPASREEIPVYIADYVLASYGTGAIMAVPAHDERDHAFAQKFGIEVKQVVARYTEVTGEDAPRSDNDIFDFRASTAIVKHWAEDKYYVVLFKTGQAGFVGGSANPGETPEQTAVRETIEESGYKNIQKINFVSQQVSRGYKSRKGREEICRDYGICLQLTDNERIDIVDEETPEGEWRTAEEILCDPVFFNHHKEFLKDYLEARIFKESGVLTNSAEFDGMNSEQAKAAITEKVGGRMTNTYRLRDWSIGRQRYWGVPIPIVYDPEGKAYVVPQEHLPWTLPEDVDFKPTGEPPLAKSSELLKRTEDIFGAGWTPEVETMDTFVDSSWYFLRYIDPHNQESPSSLDVQKDWMQIDLYMGGAEHTTMHLLYSRFWQKALHKLGLVTHDEPYKRRINRGLILGPDGNKMSKSKGNVIDPDEQVKNVGSDTVKMYLAFMGPYQGNNYPWDLGGLAGIHRFLERVYGLQAHICDEESAVVTKLLHKTIKKVSEDIEQLKFNTAVSTMMIYLNQAEKTGLSLSSYDIFLRLLAPFAPHLTEELWYDSGNVDSIHLSEFPEFDSALAKDDEVTIGVQINGKVRGEITISPEATEKEAIKMVEMDKFLKDKLEEPYKKVIYKPGKILNFITLT